MHFCKNRKGAVRRIADLLWHGMSVEAKLGARGLVTVGPACLAINLLERFILPLMRKSSLCLVLAAVFMLSQGAVADGFSGRVFKDLIVRDLAEGDGAVATPGSLVSVCFRAWIPTSEGEKGKLVDGSHIMGQPLTFALGWRMVVEAWDRGIIGMKVGGTRQLLSPSLFAHGSLGAAPLVPADSDLVFEVQLLQVVHPHPFQFLYSKALEPVLQDDRFGRCSRAFE